MRSGDLSLSNRKSYSHCMQNPCAYLHIVNALSLTKTRFGSHLITPNVGVPETPAA